MKSNDYLNIPIIVTEHVGDANYSEFLVTLDKNSTEIFDTLHFVAHGVTLEQAKNKALVQIDAYIKHLEKRSAKLDRYIPLIWEFTKFTFHFRIFGYGLYFVKTTHDRDLTNFIKIPFTNISVRTISPKNNLKC